MIQNVMSNLGLFSELQAHRANLHIYSSHASPDQHIKQEILAKPSLFPVSQSQWMVPPSFILLCKPQTYQPSLKVPSSLSYQTQWTLTSIHFPPSQLLLLRCKLPLCQKWITTGFLTICPSLLTLSYFNLLILFRTITGKQKRGYMASILSTPCPSLKTFEGFKDQNPYSGLWGLSRQSPSLSSAPSDTCSYLFSRLWPHLPPFSSWNTHVSSLLVLFPFSEILSPLLPTKPQVEFHSLANE